MNICMKNNFHVFVPTDLDLKFAPPITLVQCYDFIKLEVSTPLFWKKNAGMGQTDRETDGVQLLGKAVY